MRQLGGRGDGRIRLLSLTHPRSVEVDLGAEDLPLLPNENVVVGEAVQVLHVI